MSDLERAERELRETRATLRILFDDLEIEWPGDHLYLVDVITHHLEKFLAYQGLL